MRNGKGNQSFQLWPLIANMAPRGNQGMPDQDGLVTIDTPFPQIRDKSKNIVPTETE